MLSYAQSYEIAKLSKLSTDELALICNLVSSSYNKHTALNVYSDWLQERGDALYKLIDIIKIKQYFPIRESYHSILKQPVWSVMYAPARLRKLNRAGEFPMCFVNRRSDQYRWELEVEGVLQTAIFSTRTRPSNSRRRLQARHFVSTPYKYGGLLWLYIIHGIRQQLAHKQIPPTIYSV